MPLPLPIEIATVLGLPKGLYSANQADPNSAVWDQYNQMADEYRDLAGQDVYGGISAGIKNTLANRLYTLSQQNAASGRGQSPYSAGQAAALTSQAGQSLTAAQTDAVRRRQDLLDRANHASLAARQGQDTFRANRKARALNDYLGGAMFGLTSAFSGMGSPSGSFGGAKNALPGMKPMNNYWM